MAKAILKTTVKYSETHNRVALTIKYPNGEVLKTASNRGSDTMSCIRPAGFNDKFGKVDLNPIFKFVCKSLSSQETHGDRFARLAKFFETTESIQDAINKATV